MSQTGIVIVAAIVLVAILLLILVLRSRKQRVAFDADAVPPPLARAATPAPSPTPSARDEQHGVGSEIAAAIEDVVDQFVGIDAHPSGQQPERTGDTLTNLKGLGPKAAARLSELGVTTFEQIAAWDEGDVAAIDAQMGAFKGRIGRDKWVEQARLLSKGDTDAFETAFGKLGQA